MHQEPGAGGLVVWLSLSQAMTKISFREAVIPNSTEKLPSEFTLREWEGGPQFLAGMAQGPALPLSSGSLWLHQNEHLRRERRKMGSVQCHSPAT